jgi:hypothetical protein
VSGYYQPLTVPTVVGQTVELHVCANVLLGSWRPSTPGADIIGPNIAGLLLAEDLSVAPLTAAVRVLGQAGQLFTDSGSTLQSIGPALFDFAAFDGLPTGVAVSFSFLPYLRFRLRQTLTAPGAYTIDCAADTGFDGADWMALYQYPQVVGAAQPLASVGFAVLGGADGRVRVELGQFAVLPRAFDEFSTAIGAVQQLGAV